MAARIVHGGGGRPFAPRPEDESPDDEGPNDEGLPYCARWWAVLDSNQRLRPCDDRTLAN